MTREYIEVIGGERVRRRLAGVAERFAAPQIAFGAIMREWAERERSIFESYGGKYVRTGALRDSLTATTGQGSAIRTLTPSGFKFGTSVPYARFQGTRGSGEHEPPSAILKLEPEEVVGAERTLLSFIMHGGRA